MGAKIANIRKHLRLFGVILLLILLLISAFIISASFITGNRVTPNQLQIYALEYQNQYVRLINENRQLVNGLTDFRNFTFFENQEYGIIGITSSNHGAALFFDNTKRNDEFKEISDPIEYYFWPQMTRDTKDLSVIRISEGFYPLDSTISAQYGLLYVDPGANLRFTVKDKTFNFTNNAAVTVFGSVIKEHSLLLKGSNDKSDWSITQAGLDALSEFSWDLKSAGLNEETIKIVERKYQIPFILGRMDVKMENGEYRNNPVSFYYDYEQLKVAASGEMNQTLTDMLTDFYRIQQNPPSFWEQANVFFTQNTIGTTILSFIVGLASGFVFNRFLERPHNKEVKVVETNRVRKRRRHK